MALVGRLRKNGDSDAEAPRRSCLDLEPCDKCRRHFAKGMLAIEVTEDGSKFGNNNRFALGANGTQKRMWPTGRWAVIRPEAVKDGKPGGKFLCDSTVMDMILAAKNHDGDDEGHSEGCGKELQ